MPDYKFVGKNYQTPDLVAKVTGAAKYAEDFRAEGMLFCKLLLSPMPHARVRSIDSSAAMAMPGVKAILTVDDLPKPNAGASLGEGISASTLTERGLTMEPMYHGEPILAVAAVDELTAAEAIEKIEIEYEPLPFSVDPIESLRPRGANARTQGNPWIRPPGGRFGADQRVHGRRLRQPYPRLHRDGHSGPALEEGQRAGDDAHCARGRALHRSRASRGALTHQGRLRQGRPAAGGRSLQR